MHGEIQAKGSMKHEVPTSKQLAATLLAKYRKNAKYKI